MADAASERERAARICEALMTGTDDAADQALVDAAAALRADTYPGDPTDRAVAMLDALSMRTSGAARQALRDTIAAILDADDLAE